MSFNQVILNGKLPKFDAVYTQNNGGTSFLSWAISVKRDYKKQDEKFYTEDLIRFKAFGPKADFLMNNFAQGDGVIITGKLQKEEDYEKEDGQVVKGQLCVFVDGISFADGNMKQGGGNGNTSSNTAGGNKPSGNGGRISRPGGAPNAPAPQRPGGINRPGGAQRPAAPPRPGASKPPTPPAPPRPGAR